MMPASETCVWCRALAASLLAAAAGCAAFNHPSDDPTREAYFETMRYFNALHLPSMDYEEWRRFQNRYETIELAANQAAMDAQDPTNGAPAFASFEVWNAVRLLEQDYLERARRKGIPPDVVFEQLTLMDRHRRALAADPGNGGLFWQLYFVELGLPLPDPAIRTYFVNREPPFEGALMVSLDGSHTVTNGDGRANPDLVYRPKRKPDYPLFIPAYIDRVQGHARAVLDALPEDSRAPYSSRLRRIAAGELAHSTAMRDKRDVADAFRTAANAYVTARSAKALRDLETGARPQAVAYP